MSALPAPLPPSAPPAATRPLAAMAPHTESALGPLHASLKTGGNYRLEMPPWQEFIVPATDTKGHSQFERVAMSPMLAAEIENIVSSRIFPYRRPGEFWRHAAMKMLGWLRAVEPRLASRQSSYYGALLAEQDILKEEAVKQQTEQTFKRQDELLGLLLERGDETEAADLAYRLSQQLDHLPNTSWKQRFVRKFTRQYGDLVEDGRKLAAAARVEYTGQLCLPPLTPLLEAPAVLPVPLPLPPSNVIPWPVSAAPAAPVLANGGQPLVDLEPVAWHSPVITVEFTGSTPEEIAQSMMFGPPAGAYSPSYEDVEPTMYVGWETEYIETEPGLDYGG